MDGGDSAVLLANGREQDRYRDDDRVSVDDNISDGRESVHVDDDTTAIGFHTSRQPEQDGDEVNPQNGVASDTKEKESSSTGTKRKLSENLKSDKGSGRGPETKSPSSAESKSEQPDSSIEEKREPRASPQESQGKETVESSEKEAEEKSDFPSVHFDRGLASSKRSAATPPRLVKAHESMRSTPSDADAGHPVIFKTAPVVQELQLEYAVDKFGVSHLNFTADLLYEDQQWRVLFHRQNIVEYHTNLRSLGMQDRLRSFHPKYWFCAPHHAGPHEDELLDSTLEGHNDSGNRLLVSAPSRKGFQSDGRKTSEGRRPLAQAVREIHFPRQLLMFDRPHLFHKNIDLKVNSAQSRKVLDQLKQNVLEYLRTILANERVRNLPLTLEFFRCSSMTFDRSLGPSVIEGWVTLQKHSPNLSAVKWHTCRGGCIVCNCAYVPISHSRKYRAWIVVKDSFAAFLKKPLDPQPFYLLMYDSGFDVLKGFSTTGRRKHIYIHSNTTVADLTFSSRNEKKQWANHLKFDSVSTSWHCKDHPYGSFAPEREDGCYAKMLVDGEDYFGAVADGLESAQSEIYIGGWWVTPDVVLKRKSPEGYEYWKLSSILKRKAEQGVKVFVLMFKEVEVAIGLNSKFQESRLAKTPNIYVLRHPNFTLGGQWYWSHHEKLVVVDGVVAFFGGLDLAWGRYDNDGHALLDMGAPPIWPGIDYYNPRIVDIADPRTPDEDLLDRATESRMPWHDVSCTVSGPAARDLARHFIHQWNFAIESKSGSRSDLPLLVPRDYPVYREPDPDHAKVKCQVLRSLPHWSGGPEHNTERSIQDAYLAAIADAHHYVYIENQFFVSGMQGDGTILNRIADALYMRISRAAAEGKPFKVIVFIPLLPAFEGSVDDSGQSALRQVLFWQYRSICRGENRRSLWQMLEDNPDVGGDPGKYLAFFSLRTFDKNQVSNTAGVTSAKNKLFTEMVYIHSKIMIVDDHIAFIGSANINDRSMTGQRDSEVCVKITDLVFNKKARLRDEPWPLSGVFAHGLRMRLFEEHFGGEFLPTEVMEDFILDENFAQLKKLARSNTECYERVCTVIPSDRILTFADLRRIEHGEALLNENEIAIEEEEEEFVSNEARRKGAEDGRLKRLHSFSSIGGGADSEENQKDKLDHLNRVYGHVVEFPLKFLSRARRLKPAAGVLGDQIFT